MSVTVDSPPRPRPANRRRWLAIGAAVLAALVVTALLYVVNRPGGGEAPTANSAARGGPLRDELAGRVVAILEQSTPTEHTAHGHELGSEPGRVVCVAEVYGYEPASAATVRDVRRLVGYHLCAVVAKDRPYDYASKLVGPLIVELTEPPLVQPVESGANYPDRVRQAVGDRYYEQAMRGFSPERRIDLRERYDAAARG
jgi:hypothetical protein